jgi:membrane protein YqaA with SNARE-associated domain
MTKKVLKKALKKGKDALNYTVKKVRNTHSAIKQRIGLGFWIFVLLIFILGTIYFTTLEKNINPLIQNYGIFGIISLSFFVDLLVQPIGPDLILIVGVFSNFNPYILLISVLIGSYLAIIASYYIGKHIGSAGIEKIVGHKMFKKIENSPHYGKWILFLGAISPIPYVPYLAGVWKLNLKEVIIIILIPRTIRFIIVWSLAYFLGTNIMEIIY